ncbi:MAG: hypothetical protein GAK30_01477 [Paracidovorax wautersii]|uniref:Iron(III) transport system substrate-binding protein n=1 Tax=Paracidovorax wautersii TaxID=1177982 RepID=A0A7V8FPV9_9BURK|nr:MAG: hypothetical protein GAK30_01477 [Paracidovorax wautersii]
MHGNNSSSNRATLGRLWRRVATVAALAAVAGAAQAQAPAGYPASYAQVIDGSKKEARLVVYSTTDSKAADPLVKDFQALYPWIQVEYNDMNSTELYNRYLSEQAAGGNSGDTVWNSSMDSALKLAKQFALQYDSPERAKLPDWASWQNKAYGTTFEPAVFVYNKRLVSEAEVPRTHEAFAKLVADPKYKGKVTSYDIEKSAVGFMLAAQDAKVDPKYWDFIKAVGAAGVLVQSSTGTMLERVSSGENLLGYNILGPYAEAKAKKDPSLGIAYPTDHALVLSRVAFISRRAKNPNAAKLWLDYLLSKRGQEVIAHQAELVSVRNDIEGDNDVDGMTKKLGKALHPIPVDESLLDYLEQNKRLAFIKQWRESAGK